MLGKGPQLLKELNRSLVMRIIREEGPNSRAEIARKTGLSVPAILKIVSGLIDDGYLREIGEGQSTGGRKPVLLDIQPDGAYAIGINLTPNFIRAAMVKLNFEIAYDTRTPINPKQGYKAILQQMLTLIEEVITKSEVQRSKILGIGVAHPGVMGNEADKILIATNLSSLQNAPLGEDIEKFFHLPVTLEVDARASALAEMWLGDAAGIDNFLTIDIGFGLGSGLVLGRKIYRGSNGLAGELGHMVTEANGFACTCGKSGCLETVVAFPAIVRELCKNPSPLVLKLCEGDRRKISINSILEAAQHNDPGAIRAIRKSAQALGKALGNLLNFIDVSMIFINSKLTTVGQLYVSTVQEELEKYFLLAKEKTVQVRASALGLDSEILGASVLILQNVFWANA
ncbi:MAG: ROK family transcriptional regulator [Calditrichaeota bacterium]|nr:MAG: ROK family transcriptional regulator [Calditrichota bacterium]